MQGRIDSDFLEYLTFGCVEEAWIGRIDVTTRLEPEREFTVEDKQELLVVGTNDKRTGREVSGLVLTARCGRSSLKKSKHSLAITRLVIILGYDSFELITV